MEYPILLFNEKIAFGVSASHDNSLPLIYFSDFPLKRKTDLWKNFPAEFSYRPKVIKSLQPSKTIFKYPKIVRVESSPNYHKWEEIISKFKSSSLDKVILARKTTFTFENKLSPIDLFHFLKQKNPNSFVFAIILNQNLAFIGATPEKLFLRNEKKIQFEALAGTLPSSIEKRLLTDKKLLKEFRIVKQNLTDQLQKICKPFRIDQKIFIKKAGNVSHLHYPFFLELNESISDLELIHYLHPTPAIGGLPKNEALRFIETYEPFDRGLYAGTIGILDPKKSEVYVSIRSALLSENQLHVFAGAGIVKESDPLLEWKELDQKQRLFNL
jgi:menaquinone-specific isochorismate synthase